MSVNSTIHDCRTINLPQVKDVNGNITSINDSTEIPFPIKRVFYLYDISCDESRGSHAHKTCQQFLVAVSGSFEVVLDDGNEKTTILLDNPHKGLFIEAGIWDSQINFSKGAICLVIASRTYLEEDYLRNYNDFLNYKAII
jgi:dTDP-4-dehydrorhamnose 3,5-epimerase-like enzyme